MFFEWLANSSSVCGDCFGALVPYVNKPKQMAIRKKKQHGLLIVKKARTHRKPKHRLLQLVNAQACQRFPHVLTTYCALWTQALGKYHCVEKETDMLLSTLSAMQEKAQHLERNLSAETRIKLDLFSALGDTRRQLEIAQGSQSFLCASLYNISIFLLASG